MVVVFVPGLFIAPSAIKFLIENVLSITYTTPIALQFADGASKVWRHTWSLGIEEMFYLLWPVGLTLGLRKKLSFERMSAIAVSGGAALLIIPIILQFSGNQLMFFRSGGLFIGCSLALFLASNRDRSVRLGFGLFGILALVIAVTIGSFGVDSVAVLLSVLGSVLLLSHIVTNQNGFVSRIIGVSPISYVGRISYELYLWHYPIFVLLAWGTKTDFFSVAWLAAPLAVVLAMVSHHFLSPLVDRWKARFR